MLYTPKYCCECGSEIEQENRKILASRQFCENCEKDFKGLKLFPLIWLSLGLLGAIYGFGSYLKKLDKPVNLLTTSTAVSTTNRNQNIQNQPNLQISSNTNVPPAIQKAEANSFAMQANSQSLTTPGLKPSTGRQNSAENSLISAAEPIYICGAQTKKGTACTRRVKGGGRCWQHIGQPAILPAEKLLVTR